MLLQRNRNKPPSFLASVAPRMQKARSMAGLGVLMDFLDYMLWKLVIFVVIAFIYGFVTSD